MKTIIISEEKERHIIARLLEDYDTHFHEKIKALSDFTEQHFARCSYDKTNALGIMVKEPVVVRKDSYGQPNMKELLTKDDLFEILQANPMFRNAFVSPEERDKTIKQFVEDWFGRDITKGNNLTKY